MYQAGIKKIKLYENIGIKFWHYNQFDRQDITDLSGAGSIVDIDNTQQPAIDCKLSFSNQGEIVFSYSLDLLILGYFTANLTTLQQLKRSIYGWLMLVEFYDGNYKFYNSPIFFKSSEINPQEEMVFKVKASSAVPTRVFPYIYTPGVSTLKAFRADTTLLSADNSIYSADYSL